MTTIAETRLSADLQGLVDARLDTIDRMLLGRVDRQDRLAIVREVEGQIFELLAGRDAGTLDRDDVLAVLARLDPPEAYLPDDEAPSRPRAPRGPSAPRDLVPARRAPSGGIGLSAGILGMGSVTWVLFCASLETGLFHGADQGVLKFLFFGSMGLGFLASILAIIFAARTRLRGAWAVVGLVTGILGLVPILIFGGLIMVNGF